MTYVTTSTWDLQVINNKIRYRLGISTYPQSNEPSFIEKGQNSFTYIAIFSYVSFIKEFIIFKSNLQ